MLRRNAPMLLSRGPMEPIFNVVLPVFGIIAAGYISGRRGLLGDASSEALNRFVYWVALPVLLFKAMATVDVENVVRFDFLAGFMLSLAVVWAAAMLLAKLAFGRGLAEATMHGMNTVYGNAGYMGIPLALATYGAEAVFPAIFITVIYTALIVGAAIIMIEIGAGKADGLGPVLRKVFTALIRNPMLIAPVLGLAWAASGIPLPVPVETFSSILGAAAGPCALFAIGLFLVGKPLREGLGEVTVMTVVKLAVQPLVTAVFMFWLFPVDPLWGKVAVLMATLPTGAGSFVLSLSYGLYVQRTSSVILISTIASVATISVFYAIFPPTV